MVVCVHVAVALLLLLLKVCFLSLHIYSGRRRRCGKSQAVREEKLTDLGLCYPNCVQINWTQRTQQANTAVSLPVPSTSSLYWSWSVAVPRCAADQTLCLLNLKRLPARSPMGAKNVCGGERKTQSFLFFLCHSQYFFCRSFTLAVLGLLGFLGALTALAALAARLQPANPGQ